MHEVSTIVDIIRERQKAMRREMVRRGIAMKAVAMDSGVDYYTLLTYFPADKDKTPAQIPGSVIYALTGHLPADILSLLLPAGHLIVQAPEEIDHDQIADAMVSYLADKQHAHHPESECGPAIGPSECEKLTGKFAVVVGGRAA
jgi:hypothetical protein